MLTSSVGCLHQSSARERVTTKHTCMHVQHSYPTEQHGSYLPSWAAKIPLCVEKTDKQRLCEGEVLGSDNLVGLRPGHAGALC